MRSNRLFNESVLLIPLQNDVADEYYLLYSTPKITEHYEGEAIKPNETAEDFAVRIASSCNDIWTIRDVQKPNRIIGDIALHDFNKTEGSIEIGGSLLPEYWGKGTMRSAFSLVVPYARKKYSVRRIWANTTLSNKNAMRFGIKYGFQVFNETSLFLDLD